MIPPTRTPSASSRLSALDGMRCLAILPVLLYHYLYFWSSAGKGLDIVAYDDAFAEFPLASVGYLGVHLFFVISGFVILLTLERTQSLRDFFIRRLIRLWPPLLLFGTLTFAVVHIWGPDPLRVSAFEYVVSLFFLPPEHVGALLGARDWSWVDGAYWSLWVEVRFYVVCGVLYFMQPSKIARNWLLFELGALLVGTASHTLGSSALDKLQGLLFQEFIPLFSFGIASYLAFVNRRDTWVDTLAAVALAHAALTTYRYLGPHAGLTADVLARLLAEALIFLLFYLFAWRRWRLAWLESRPLVQIGGASYGIYLVHQNVGLAILDSTWFLSGWTAVLGVIGTILGMIALGVISYHYFEMPAQRLLKMRLIRKATGHKR